MPSAERRVRHLAGSSEMTRARHSTILKGMEGDEKLRADEAQHVTDLSDRETSISGAVKAAVEKPGANPAAFDVGPGKNSEPEKHPELHKWATFLQGVIHFDTTKMEPWIGLRNALGVCLPLAGGIALGMPLGGLALASGALNVSYTDGHEPYRERARRMLSSSAICAIAVMAGGLAGHHHVAIALATAWAFGSGMAIALGTVAESLGVISLVVLIIYSAQSLTPDRALQAGGLAFAGGVVQTFFSLALWPLRTDEPERRTLANLYMALAKAAANATLLMQTPPAIEASTSAQQALAYRASDHSVQSERLRSLLSQAERMRLRLFTLGRMLRRMRREKFGFAPAEMIESFLESSAKAMTAIAESLVRRTPVIIDDSLVAALRSSTEALRENHETREATFLAAVVRDARLQMDALLGQLRAAAQLVGDVAPAGAAIFRKREQKRPWRMRFGGNLARLAANITFRSAVFRHAVRLSVTVAAAEILSRSLETPRAYWLPMTVVLVLKPEFTITFTRGLLRIAGTIVGLLLATAMFHFLPKGIGLEVMLVGGFVFLLRWAGPANYGVFGVAVSALIVLLIAISGVAPKDVILARGINTLLGGVLALVAYGLWPTWERRQVGEVMARLLEAYRAYASLVFDCVVGREQANAAELDKVRMAARLARTNAVGSVDRMQAEPGTSAGEVGLLIGMLASSHRFIHAVMSVEAGTLSVDRRDVTPELRGFSADVLQALDDRIAELRLSRAAGSRRADLRESYRRLSKAAAPTEEYALLMVEADRMTNSLNTLREQIAKWRLVKTRRRDR
jgi:uncharacterized membrane protein YccC